jgi:diguanylate cyclase (GGDEF)-like protein
MAKRRRIDQPWNPPTRGPDISAVFVLFAAGPLLLPLIGVNLDEVAWGLTVLVCGFATVRGAAAGLRNEERRGMWLSLSAACLAATLAAVLGIAISASGVGAKTAFYVGFAGSVGLLAGAALFARRSLAAAHLGRLGDAALLGTLILAVGVYFVAVPGFARGDSLLTLVFVVDVCALLVGALATLARPDRRHRRNGWWLVVACAAASTGDGLSSAAAAGQVRELVALVALLWTVTGAGLAVAADLDVPVASEAHRPELSGRRWLLGRVVMPLVAVLALPAVATAIWLADGLRPWQAAYFFGFFVFALGLTFGRQAYLLLENRLAVTRERSLLEQVIRRNEELEALTGLATTMTETLEEEPIIERGLDVLRLAARTTSAALYLDEGEALVLSATTGDWSAEHTWAGDPAGSPGVDLRGGRQVVRLSLTARGSRLGRVTLLRPLSDPVDDAELDLLRLLCDQLAIALQNARDYRDKLEQAIRDPLTGLLNHRAFQERLGSELSRARREGYEVALVALDLDHFKPINDRCGHAMGDEALIAFARTISGSLRPSDIAGRVGGDEFMVALPETSVKQAQQIVARLRDVLVSVAIGPTRETLTVSAGIAMYPRAAEYQADLMRFADGAMYWSKSSGRDRVSVYAPDSGEALSPEEKAEHAQRASLVRTVHALARAVDAKDGYTHLHSQRVAFYAATLAVSLGLPPENVEMIRTAGVLHDVGKIGITDSILLKPGRLDEAELAEMKRHSELGRDIIAGAGMGAIADWVCHLHERFDGGGYPARLAGDSIPLESRILSVADALEAMTYPRVYRPALSLEAALAELERGAGSQFDPDVAARLVELVRSGELQVGNSAIDSLELPSRRAAVS